jgi:signal transduction histidine kinase
MSFNRLASPQPLRGLPRSASDLAGIGDRGGAGLSFPGGPANSRAGSPDARGAELLEERKRIAQELHDTLLQGFFAVSMQLQTVVDQLPSDSAAKPRFDDVLQAMDRVLEEGRRAVQGLRSPVEPARSLGEDFADVPNELGFPLAVDYRVILHGSEKDLRAAARHEIYRIGREAIINAYRHSQATKVEAEIDFGPAELRVAVRDNGRGIDPQSLRWGRDGHWGIQGMRERADRIGARLHLRSEAGLGTEVELRVPGAAAFEQAKARFAS